jgi:hypothetical protein
MMACRILGTLTPNTRLSAPLAMSNTDDDTVNSPMEVKKVDKEKEKKKIFGLDLTDPQDWITIILSGIIFVNTADLLFYYGQKLLGMK